MRFAKKISALLLTLALFAAAAGCGEERDGGIPQPEQSSDDSDWTAAGTQTVVLENSAVRFELDPSTTHFTVTDKLGGKTYSSVPPEGTAAFSDEDQNRLKSELTVTYYEEQSTAQYMYSARDSVEQGTFEIRYRDSRVRVYYHLGAAGDESVVPEVFSEEEFDSVIIAAADDPNIRRRLLRFYDLYASNDTAPDDYAERLEQYPALAETSLYILSPDVSEAETEEIAGIMSDIGYGKDDYEASLERLGIEEESSEGAGFTVPVEYALTEDGFTAGVLSDKISESSQSCFLQTVEFLEYFAASGGGSEERYVIPDGSGSLIKINGQHKTMYSQSFYGADYSVNEADKTQLAQNLMLPVYGISGEDYGLLAVIEAGAEAAVLNINPISNSAPLNHIYVSFAMRAMDVTDIGKNMQVPVYNLFSGHLLETSPKIRYIFLPEDKADYSSMAARHREYLIDNGTLQRNTSDASALDIEFLCMIIEEKNALGISYHSKTVLSTLSEITETVKKLQDLGVGPINVRLKGYGSGGLSKKAANDFSIDSDVGSIQQLESLRELLENNGGRLWLDADFQFVYSAGNGFSKNNDAAHYLNRTIVCRGDYDIVTREYDNSRLFRYFVSPYVYAEFAQGFLSGLFDAVDDGGLYGISYGTSGMYLGGDYARRDIDRVQSRQLLDTALENAGNSLMFDNGNAYVLKYAKRLLQVPSVSSGFDMEERSIPFYQLVVHGYVPYSGISENISRQPETSLLKAAEYGAAISRTWITRENSLLTNTEYELDYYSVNADSGLDSLLEDYRRIRECYEATYDSAIRSHSRISDNLYRTDYENGASVLVNYGGEPAEAGGVTVNAEDFVLSAEGG